ncbi:MAG: ribonuclease HII [Anaerolineae bacterium]|nr:ribonuclease HII [Anaerolineae bacterium]
MTTHKNKTASLRHEKEYFRHGYRYIFGLDEVGRGPWAGPVAAGAVCLPLDNRQLSIRLRGVRDSKEMSAMQRDDVVAAIQETALAWGIGHATVEEINATGNLVKSTRLAMQRALDMAIENSDIQPSCLFLDYNLWPEMGHIPQVSILGGDQLSLTIAAASVLAKTWRDTYMEDVAVEFPQYGFESHKGYGTEKHREALKKYGVTSVHRTNYAPIIKIMNGEF